MPRLFPGYANNNDNKKQIPRRLRPSASAALITFILFFFYLVQSVKESFFGDALYDSRFTSSDYHSFPSTHAIETDPISFNLPALKSGSVYRINQGGIQNLPGLTMLKGEVEKCRRIYNF